MFYLDNSETSWLVYADWLEDQDIDATHIREIIANPIINGWAFDYYCGIMGGVSPGVGCFNTNDAPNNNNHPSLSGVGTDYSLVGVGFNMPGYHYAGSINYARVGG